MYINKHGQLKQHPTRPPAPRRWPYMEAAIVAWGMLVWLMIERSNP